MKVKALRRLAPPLFLAGVLSLPTSLTLFAQPTPDGKSAGLHWTASGWGGGGFYYSCAFHPTRDGVIYLGGDVAGMYKTVDHGKNWRLINNGLADYGVFSIAVDVKSPDTVYAATSGGLCKSTDAGETWRTLPNTGKKGLRLTGEKNKGFRAVAVDPTDSKVVYAGSPSGKVYKSADGGETWAVVNAPGAGKPAPESLLVQFGKKNADFFGGFWLSLALPADKDASAATGLGFDFMGEGSVPREFYLTLKTKDGTPYRTANLADIFNKVDMQEVLLKGKDFQIDPQFAKKSPEKAAQAPKTPDWAQVNRVDFGAVGDLPDHAYPGRFARVFLTSAAGPLVYTDLGEKKEAQSYGNITTGEKSADGGGTVFAVAIAPSRPAVVAAATESRGLVLSTDAGQTWNELATPKKATGVVFDPKDAKIIYGLFGTDGVYKSTDGGQTWAQKSQGIDPKAAATDLVINPKNPLELTMVAPVGWGGGIFLSTDGGETWKNSPKFTKDVAHDPTGVKGDAVDSVSNPKNIALNPRNPKEMYIAANWRSLYSADGGQSWEERMHGADITCVTDIRFLGDRTYVTAMDEGTFVTRNNGAQWTQLWPVAKFDPSISGHYWQVAVSGDPANPATDKIVTTGNPWNEKTNIVVRSDDGGKTFEKTSAGLPDTRPTVNTMWGEGYTRALAADPHDPKTLYLGLDGDPAGSHPGGGIFKSTDGGGTWAQLPNQPASRRMFFGLAVDPTDSKRLYWGACNTNGGLYRSDDAGQSWKLVFKQDQWIFNVHVGPDGTVYCPAKDLWRSTDHGETWQKISSFDDGQTIVGLDTDPKNPQRLWIARTSWDGASTGGILESTDGGKSWANITGDIGVVKPIVLRYNPFTSELWAGGPTLHRVKR